MFSAYWHGESPWLYIGESYLCHRLTVPRGLTLLRDAMLSEEEFARFLQRRENPAPRNAAEAAAERERGSAARGSAAYTITSPDQVLLAACCEPDGASAVAILENGASEAMLNCVSPFEDGYSPLMLAMQTRCTRAIARLLQDERVNINYIAKNGQTPLSIAASHGLATYVRSLLARNAAPYKTSERMVPPIFMAAQIGHPHCVELLLAANASTASCEDPVAALR